MIKADYYWDFHEFSNILIPTPLIKDSKKIQKKEDTVSEEFNLPLEYFESQPEQTDPSILYQIGKCYENGIYREQSLEKAFYYYKSAADRGELVAQIKVGDWLLEGKGVDRSYQEAFHYYLLIIKELEITQKSEEKSLFISSAFMGLAELYEKGLGCEKSLEKAFYYYKLSADEGDIIAQLRVAECLKEGKGTNRSYIEAFHYYLLVINHEEGDSSEAHSYFVASALVALAQCYEKGEGCVKNLEKADECYTLALDKNKSSCFYSYLIRFYLKNQVKLDYAFHYLKFIVQGGLLCDSEELSFFQWDLARCYENGIGVKKSFKRAFYYYNLSFKNYRIDCFASCLGRFYLNGLGVHKSYRTALKYYRFSLKNGMKHSRRFIFKCLSGIISSHFKRFLQQFREIVSPEKFSKICLNKKYSSKKGQRIILTQISNDALQYLSNLEIKLERISKKSFLTIILNLNYKKELNDLYITEIIAENLEFKITGKNSLIVYADSEITFLFNAQPLLIQNYLNHYSFRFMFSLSNLVEEMIARNVFEFEIPPYVVFCIDVCYYSIICFSETWDPKLKRHNEHISFEIKDYGGKIFLIENLLCSKDRGADLAFSSKPLKIKLTKKILRWDFHEALSFSLDYYNSTYRFSLPKDTIPKHISDPSKDLPQDIWYEGHCYQKGMYREQSIERAVQLYQMAAQKKYPPAYLSLARYYHSLLNSKSEDNKNFSLAMFNNLKLASDQMKDQKVSVCASLVLARIYKKRGLMKEALFYYEKAAEGNLAVGILEYVKFFYETKTNRYLPLKYLYPIAKGVIKCSKKFKAFCLYKIGRHYSQAINSNHSLKNAIYFYKNSLKTFALAGASFGLAKIYRKEETFNLSKIVHYYKLTKKLAPSFRIKTMCRRIMQLNLMRNNCYFILQFRNNLYPNNTPFDRSEQIMLLKHKLVNRTIRCVKNNFIRALKYLFYYWEPSTDDKKENQYSYFSEEMLKECFKDISEEFYQTVLQDEVKRKCYEFLMKAIVLYFSDYSFTKFDLLKKKGQRKSHYKVKKWNDEEIKLNDAFLLDQQQKFRDNLYREYIDFDITHFENIEEAKSSFIFKISILFVIQKLEKIHSPTLKKNFSQ